MHLPLNLEVQSQALQKGKRGGGGVIKLLFNLSLQGKQETVWGTWQNVGGVLILNCHPVLEE